MIPKERYMDKQPRTRSEEPLIQVCAACMHLLTISPLNKIMNHTFTALWTIPTFEFGELFYQFCNSNFFFIHYLNQTVQTLIRRYGFCGLPG